MPLREATLQLPIQVGTERSQAGACRVPRRSLRPVAPACPRAHLSSPARPWPERALPTQLRTREAQAAEFLPPRGAEGRVRLGSRVGGRSCGRRLCCWGRRCISGGLVAWVACACGR